jgi:hypothetical protein
VNWHDILIAVAWIVLIAFVLSALAVFFFNLIMSING